MGSRSDAIFTFGTPRGPSDWSPPANTQVRGNENLGERRMLNGRSIREDFRIDRWHPFEQKLVELKQRLLSTLDGWMR